DGRRARPEILRPRESLRHLAAADDRAVVARDQRAVGRIGHDGLGHGPDGGSIAGDTDQHGRHRDADACEKGLHDSGLRQFIYSRCSATGPSVAAGKKVSAPMTMMVAASRVAKTPPSTLSVPLDSALRRLADSEPTMARGRMIGLNRASSMTMPVARFHGTVSSPSPSKPEPLLALAEVNSYRISLKPCGPTLLSVSAPQGVAAKIAVPPRMNRPRARSAKSANCTSSSEERR